MTATDAPRAPASAPRDAPRLPLTTAASMFVRLLAVQGSFNYEILMGNGIGFCLEPALRRLPGGVHGQPFKSALARESRYFNAHPYLASIAVGALARVELEEVPADRIERFRTALCGPLGSVGDQLVWAGWLPFCSLACLALFGFGAGPLAVVATFLVLYNAGHITLRIWGLRNGWQYGLRVASALAHPVLRRGPLQIGRLAALTTGIAVPLALHRVIGPGRALVGEFFSLQTGIYGGMQTVGVVVVIGLAVLFGAAATLRLQGKLEGWRVALVALGVFTLISILP
jgi:PTS system mannose-specific IID component